MLKTELQKDFTRLVRCAIARQAKRDLLNYVFWLDAHLEFPT
jgi:hypothetical protein